MVVCIVGKLLHQPHTRTYGCLTQLPRIVNLNSTPVFQRSTHRYNIFDSTTVENQKK